MRNQLCAVIALAAGCGGAIGRTTRDYDVMASELARLDRARAAAPPPGDPFAGASVLDRAALVAAVLAADPELGARREAWRAAVAEASGAGGLDDPMIRYEIAPGSIPGDMRIGQRVTLRQRLPTPGRRSAEAAMALGDAAVGAADYRAAQLEVAAMASDLYDDYFVAARAIDITAQHRALLVEMKAAAEARVAAGRGAVQEVLAAEVELGELDREALALATERADSVGRINGLLHRAPDAPLPPPPAVLPPRAPAPEAAIGDAQARRPEPAAARAELAVATAAITVARRAGWPEVEVMAGYDAMWDEPAHRFMVGIEISLPIWRAPRTAGVAAARARRASAEAELAARNDAVAVEVDRAARQARESAAAVALYDERLVPAARDAFDAALAGLTAGQVDFPTVIAAERALRDVELGAHRERAELSRRTTALDRAAGRLPGGAP